MTQASEHIDCQRHGLFIPDTRTKDITGSADCYMYYLMGCYICKYVLISKDPQPCATAIVLVLSAFAISHQGYHLAGPSASSLIYQLPIIRAAEE